MKEKNKKINILKSIKLKDLFLENDFFERTSKKIEEKIDKLVIERGYVYEQNADELNLIVTYRTFMTKEENRIAYYTLTFRIIFATEMDFESFIKDRRAESFFLKNYVDNLLWPYLRIYLNEVLTRAKLPQILLPISIIAESFETNNL